ncbi:MAG: hypothetical protein M3P24_06745 [Gemmatimonadota bacterium]|nr:hypothetical protein [Gemmatimonadota bacterium]
MKSMLLLVMLLALPVSYLQAQVDHGVPNPASGALVGQHRERPLASRAAAPFVTREALAPALLARESFSPAFQQDSRFERAMAGAGYGALIGGVTFGLADYLAGPFFNSTPAAFSVALSSLIGAVLVGMPIGAVVGAATGG